MGMSGEKVWKAHEARKVLTAWKKSGLALSRFEREMGLSSNRLRWWKRQLGESNAPSEETETRFVPAVVTVRRASASVALVHAPCGVTIEVVDTGGVPAQWVAAVARELARV